jgi:hypothetical protein
VPLETRGAIARYDAARDILEMYGAAKVPHFNRDAIARMLGRPASSVHLHEAFHVAEPGHYHVPPAVTPGEFLNLSRQLATELRRALMQINVAPLERSRMRPG